MDIYNQYRGKKVLVTGHTGFKGSWLTIWLKMLGADVYGYSLEAKTANDLYVLTGLRNQVVELISDIRKFKIISSFIKKTKPEIVFHLAAQSLVSEGYKDPLNTYSTNIMGTVNLLEACRNQPSVGAIVIITSDKCYANREWIWGYRENDPLGGYDPYSASKGASEIIIHSFGNSFFNISNYDEHNKAIASARSGNVIGGGDWSINRLVPDCIRSLEMQKEIRIRNPEAIRPWQHVLEPLNGYLILAIKLLENPKKFSGAWNFGPYSSNILKVKEIVQKIINLYGQGGKWITGQKSIFHEAMMLNLDINKSIFSLQWYPLLNIDETLTNTIEWYKRYNKENISDYTMSQIDEYMKKWNSLKED